MKIKSAEELAKALKDNDWVASKTTDKTIAIMAGLGSIPWDKVKIFSLRWDTELSEIVPIINIMMHSHNYKDGEEPDMVEVDVESLMEEKEDI